MNSLAGAHAAKLPRNPHAIENAIDELYGLRQLLTRVSSLADTLLGSEAVPTNDPTAVIEQKIPGGRLPALDHAAVEANELHAKIVDQLIRMERAIG